MAPAAEARSENTVGICPANAGGIYEMTPWPDLGESRLRRFGGSGADRSESTPFEDEKVTGGAVGWLGGESAREAD